MMERENFGTKVGAILAAAGSAVGLGNIWRFPIETGRNGGAAFILIYIGCIIVLGLPVMLSEFVIGRSAHANAAGAFKLLAPGTAWKWVGRMGVFAGMVVLSYYSVVAGWTVEYAMLALSNCFSGMTVDDYPRIFSEFSSNPWMPAIWLVFFLLLTHVVIVRGVTKGIERWSKVLMPVLFIIIALLVVCSVMLPGAGSGIDFLLRPDFSKVNGDVVLNAMGQAFFSLSLGLGCLCTYASYFSDETNLPRAATNVCTIDTLIALMAGFIIFPAAAASGYELGPNDIGPSLIFITLPNVFQQAFAGLPLLCYLFSVLFYLLLILAALTSTISMHEIVTSYACEEYKMSRTKGASVATSVCVILGILCSLSFGPLSGVHIAGMSIFDLCDWMVSKLCMPIGAFFISLFVGWRLDRELLRKQLSGRMSILVFMLRYVTPLAILAIFLNQFGIF